MNDIKKTVLSKFVVQTPILETNEINTNSLTLAGQSLEEFIEQNMGGTEAIEQLQSKVGTLETSVGEINGEIEELSSKSYAFTDSDNTFSGQNSFTTLSTENLTVTNTVPNLDVVDFSINGESFDAIKEQIIADAKFKTPDDYPRFMKRVALPSSGVYYLWNDLGALVYTNYNFSTATSISGLFSETGIVSFDYDCPNVTNASLTFSGCEELTEMVGNDFSKVSNGRNMFENCISLQRVEIDFPKLSDAWCMFSGCTKLTSFVSSNLDSLKSSEQMFYNAALQGTFVMDLPSATNVKSMFGNNKNLVGFKGKLPKATYCDGMFGGCSSFTTFETESLETASNTTSMFDGTKISSFSYDLPNVITANYMFRNVKEGITTFDVNVNSVQSARSMFEGCTSLITFNTEMPQLGANNGDATYMFKNCSSIKNITTNLPNLKTGDSHFLNCKSLETFICPSLDSLTNGYQMFYGCEKLKSFSSSMNSITSATNMFWGCSELETFSTPTLATLTGAQNMFRGCSSLKSFNCPLNALTNGNGMFLSCAALESFESSNMSSVTNGSYFLGSCTSLTHFRGSLKSLTNGSYMFNGCKLDKESTLHVINSLKTENTKMTAGTLTLGVNSSLKTDADVLAAIGLSSVSSSTTTSSVKITGAGGGVWTVSVQWNN